MKLLFAAPLLALVAACGSTATSAAPPKPRPTATASPTASPTPAALDQTTVLRLGARTSMKGATVQVLRYRRDVHAYGAPRGQRWDGLLVRTCITYPGGSTISWQPWALTDAGGGVYPASETTYDDFPVPAYPFDGDKVFARGMCAKGWILFGVPKHGRAARVVYQDEQDEVRTWALR